MLSHGKRTIITADRDYIRIDEEVYADWATVKKVTRYTETVRVASHKDILAHFLKLLDEQDNGTVHDIGLQCITDKKTGQMRIEKSWTVKQ